MNDRRYSAAHDSRRYERCTLLFRPLRICIDILVVAGYNDGV